MTGIDPKEQAMLKTIYDLLDRYQNLEAEKIWPLLAVRLLCVQRGYGNIVKAAEVSGVDTAVRVAQSRLSMIAYLWKKMVAANPPPEEIRAGVMDNIDTMDRASLDVNVTARLYKQINRMLTRENWLRSKGDKDEA